jgi:1,4-alpha-glucan branching enzyme
MKKQASSRNGSNRNQTFALCAPDASSVKLAGDFTHWDQQPVNLQKGPDGVWRTVLELTPGEHYYRFLVDGQWHDDPECTLRVPNPFGSENMIREVA